jgi:SAM-dependent methyltransferase
MKNNIVIFVKKLFFKLTWKDIEYFDETWKLRIKAMSELIDEEQTILDLGCGKGWLKEYIPTNIIYNGADYIKRDESTIVCDFNLHQFPSLKVDLCFVSGCLEYINDVNWFIEQISLSCKFLIISYCTTDLFPSLKSREKLCWVNHFSYQEIVRIIESKGFILMNSPFVISGNKIMKFKKI